MITKGCKGDLLLRCHVIHQNIDYDGWCLTTCLIFDCWCFFNLGLGMMIINGCLCDLLLKCHIVLEWYLTDDGHDGNQQGLPRWSFSKMPCGFIQPLVCLHDLLLRYHIDSPNHLLQEIVFDSSWKKLGLFQHWFEGKNHQDNDLLLRCHIVSPNYLHGGWCLIALIVLTIARAFYQFKMKPSFTKDGVWAKTLSTWDLGRKAPKMLRWSFAKIAYGSIRPLVAFSTDYKGMLLLNTTWFQQTRCQSLKVSCICHFGSPCPLPSWSEMNRDRRGEEGNGQRVPRWYIQSNLIELRDPTVIPVPTNLRFTFEYIPMSKFHLNQLPSITNLDKYYYQQVTLINKFSRIYSVLNQYWYQYTYLDKPYGSQLATSQEHNTMELAMVCIELEEWRNQHMHRWAWICNPKFFKLYLPERPQFPIKKSTKSSKTTRKTTGKTTQDKQWHATLWVKRVRKKRLGPLFVRNRAWTGHEHGWRCLGPCVIPGIFSTARHSFINNVLELYAILWILRLEFAFPSTCSTGKEIVSMCMDSKAMPRQSKVSAMVDVAQTHIHLDIVSANTCAHQGCSLERRHLDDDQLLKMSSYLHDV